MCAAKVVEIAEVLAFVQGIIMKKELSKSLLHWKNYSTILRCPETSLLTRWCVATRNSIGIELPSRWQYKPPKILIFMNILSH